MKHVRRFSLCVLAMTCGMGAVAATPSVNGANVFALPSIIDAQGGTWTIEGGVIEKNGKHVGNNYNVDLLLEYNQVFYQRNISNEWYEWINWGWSPTVDPRIVSSNGTRIGMGDAVLVDSQKHVWTLPSDQYAYQDGDRAAGNYNTIAILYYDNVVYCENTSDEWYAWSGTSWTQVPGDPTTNDTQAPSANGASIGVGGNTLVDAGGNVWTLPSNEWAYINGSHAGGNYNTILLLYYDGVIYSENTSGYWYAWGSNWTQVAADPRGPSLLQTASYSSPVCPASAPGCIPAGVNDSSVTFSRTTTKGDAIWVAATVSDCCGVHVISVTDSQNNTYYQLGQENDGMPGMQSVAHFYAGNIAGGADTITVHWTGDNYKGVLAAEIAGVHAAPLVGSAGAIQDGNLPAGQDNIGSNAVAMNTGAAPALMVALTMDTDGGGSDTGGSGNCAVPAGSGFIQVLQSWSWAPAGQPACDLATFETKTLSGTGSVTGSFTTTYLSDPYVTVAAVFH